MKLLPLLLLLLSALAPQLSSGEIIRQASEGRLWLKIPADQAPLRDVRVSSGSVTPAHWEKDPSLRERQTEILFPISWWKWTELTVSFTPDQDGMIELLLLGPWGDENGNAIRREVYYDDISATGAEILNGGFEVTSNNQPASWTSPWGPYPAADSWPLKSAPPARGHGLATAFQNRPLSQQFEVTAGQGVTLKLHAMAASPPDFTPPKRLGKDTPAHRALAGVKRGVNLGNGWESPPGESWGIHFDTDDVDRIAAEGFDHIRVPVAWHYHLKPGANGPDISPTLLAELEPVLRRAIDKGLTVFLNWHHFHDFTESPREHSERFIAGWKAIARHFKSWPPGLFYELLNEPCDALSTELANPIYQKTINAIRAIDPERILVISPGHWGQVGELDRLRLPDDDERLIVTVHCYEPYHFTHQGAGWVGLGDLRGVIYPGPPVTPLQLPPSLRENSGVRSFLKGYNSLPAAENPSSARPIRESLDIAREWSERFGRPVHLGEFGAHGAGDPASRTRYLRDMRTLAEARKIPWTVWEWKAGFGYWDPEKNKARFRSSLFE